MQNASDDEMTPPRSLGRYAPAVRLRRALPAHREQDETWEHKAKKEENEAPLPFFHRLRPPDKHHEI
ncbi:hypothetical protein SOASR014_46750 [Pectobacterium carotovorum subsp. carotovorum]|nr:hypothetical protein SOASR014_46750 [Pectobacterium carotovorum subsp. carotovorum]GLX47015.1 hypothetical protein Pcaca01_46830 [Pectobacterium carotovorum subsp. carotovorum]